MHSNPSPRVPHAAWETSNNSTIIGNAPSRACLHILVCLLSRATQVRDSWQSVRPSEFLKGLTLSPPPANSYAPLNPPFPHRRTPAQCKLFINNVQDPSIRRCWALPPVKPPPAGFTVHPWAIREREGGRYSRYTRVPTRAISPLHPLPPLHRTITGPFAVFADVS